MGDGLGLGLGVALAVRVPVGEAPPVRWGVDVGLSPVGEAPRVGEPAGERVGVPAPPPPPPSSASTVTWAITGGLKGV